MVRVRTWIWLIAAAAVAAGSAHAAAQAAPQAAVQAKNPALGGTSWQSASESELGRLNSNTVSIIAGNPSGTYLQMAYDMALVLDGEQIRVLPIVGRGGGQNVLDLLKLHGIDLAITQTDILKHFRKHAPNGPNLADRLSYITKLHNEELHVLARDGVGDIRSLANKTVNFGETGSSEDISGHLIFDILGIPVVAVNVGQSDALVMMRAGKIDATLMIAGKPSALLQTIPPQDHFKLLPVPFTQAMEDDYLPTSVSNADYPNLVARGTPVETVAVGAVLVTYNWGRTTDRYNRISRFVNLFFGQLAEFQKPPRHPKWAEVNVAATLPGWRRFPAAQDWLDGTTRKNATAQQ